VKRFDLRRALTRIYAGEIVLQSKLSQPGERVTIVQKLGPNNRAMAIRVIGVDQQSEDSADQPAIGRTITVVVTPDQGQRLALAAGRCAEPNPAPVAPETSYRAKNHRGDQILLRTGGSSAAWGPGDFGFLDPSSANLGTTCAGEHGLNNIVICLVGAVQNITSCYSQRGVDVQPGQAVGVWNDAFNMRFDRYSASLKSLRTNADYQPAPAIVSGQVSQCGKSGVTPSTNSIGFPHDSCFAAGTCTRAGNGTWDYEKYIGWNYGTAAYRAGTAAYNASWDDHLTAFAVDAAPGSRYETYLREIAYHKTLATGSPLLTGRDETGVAQCYSGPKTAGANRRVVIAAGIDCTANPINGAATNVPVAEFFEMFLTDPVGSATGSPATFDLYVEIIGSAGLAGYTSAGIRNLGVFL
jgi:hypothetical protein